jgi:hypothetical protein
MYYLTLPRRPLYSASDREKVRRYSLPSRVTPYTLSATHPHAGVTYGSAGREHV